jgi:hypothetical protein
VSSVPDERLASPLQWGAANLYWTPSGYVLSMPMYLNARAAKLFEDSGALATPGAELLYELIPAVWTKKDGGTAVEPGEFRVTWPQLPDMAGQALRELLEPAARKARREADEQDADDEKVAKEFLRQLRGDAA